MNSEVRWACYCDQPIVFCLLRPQLLANQLCPSYSIQGFGNSYALSWRGGKSIIIFRDVFIFVDTQRFQLIDYMFSLSLYPTLTSYRTAQNMPSPRLLRMSTSPSCAGESIPIPIPYWKGLPPLILEHISHTLTYHAANLLHKYIYTGLVTSLITLPQLPRQSKG